MKNHNLRFFFFLRVRLVDCNDDYIGIEICITMNTRCCNVILITIHLFGDKTVRTMKLKHFKLNCLKYHYYKITNTLDKD